MAVNGLNRIFCSMGMVAGVTNDLLVSSLILERYVISLAAGTGEMYRH